MTRINATSLNVLLEEFRKIPDKVPPRGMGRLKEHTEPWVMKRLVASLAAAEALHFPMSIELRDRPDIIVSSGGRRIGIELIELVPPAYAHAAAIANCEFPEAIVDRSIFGWGTSWTAAAIRDHLRNQGHRLSGPGWMGDAVEREWGAAVRDAIDKKTERLNHSSFERCSENWLGTYASSPGPGFDADIGIGFLNTSDLGRGRYERSFDLAANLVSDYVVTLAKTLVTKHPVVI